MYEETVDSMLPTIGFSGMKAPGFQDILDSWKTIFRDIYGQDIYIEPDSKDGVLLSLIAYAIHGCNNTAIATYNSFSPATSKSTALSNTVKINGIVRKSASNSTVDLLITGSFGTTITNGSVRDTNNAIWNLPTLITIGASGTVTATAICATSGAVAALPGTITQINTPTLGWIAVTNPVNATVGTQAESDAELRLRQTQSVALPSKSVMEGMLGAIANLSGVTRYKGYDNDTDSTDENGVPAHNITIVVEGGDAMEIATTIAIKKTPGVPTFGTTTVAVPQSSRPINFFRPKQTPIYAKVKIKALTGYTTDIGRSIRQVMSDYINKLYIGDSLYLSRLYVPATLDNSVGGETYDVIDITMGKNKDALVGSNISIAFNESAICSAENIEVITVAS